MTNNLDTIKEIIKIIAEILENSVIAFLFSVTILIFIGKLRPIWWMRIVTLSLAFLIADILSHYILRGGSGIAQILPDVLGYKTRHQGHVYLVFFLAILLVPVMSDIFATYFTEIMLVAQDDRILIFVSSLISILVFWDLKSTFYKRKKKGKKSK